VDGDAHDDNIGERLVATIGGDGLNRVDDATGIFVLNEPKNGVLALKPLSRNCGDEKL
jgi:hypothetical protein